MRILKYFIYLIIFIVLFAVATVIGLASYVNPNDYKDQINQQLTQKTGRSVNVNGNIAWSFWPTVGFKFQNVSVAQPLTTIREVEVRVRPLPLLKKQIQITSFTLSGIQIQQNNLLVSIDKLDATGHAVVISQKNLQATGQVKINTLQAGNLRAQNIEAQIKLADNIVTINSISAKLYEGQYTGRLSYDLNKNTVMVNQTLKAIQLQPLMQDLRTVTHLNVSGVGDVTSELTSRGKTQADLIKYLDGNVQFSVTQGILQGINIEHLLKVLSALRYKEAIPADPEPKETPFEKLTGTFQVSNGVAYNKDLLLRASFMQTTGAGKIDLGQQNIDYRLEAVKINPENQQLRNDILPILIKGPLANPHVTVDFQSILQVVISKEVEKQADKLEEKLKEKVGQALQKLFKK